MDRIFLDIVRVLSNFMNFHVASMNGNNSTFYGDSKIQKQLSRSTFIIRGDLLVISIIIIQ